MVTRPNLSQKAKIKLVQQAIIECVNDELEIYSNYNTLDTDL
jgi:hypothetical protein